MRKPASEITNGSLNVIQKSKYRYISKQNSLYNVQYNEWTYATDIWKASK